MRSQLNNNLLGIHIINFVLLCTLKSIRFRIVIPIELRISFLLSSAGYVNPLCRSSFVAIGFVRDLNDLTN